MKLLTILEWAELFLTVVKKIDSDKPRKKSIKKIPKSKQ